MTENYYFTWYIDVSIQPYMYAYTYWIENFKGSYRYGLKVSDEATTYQLIEANSGSVNPSELADLITTTIAYDRFSQSATVLFDNSPEMEVLAANLKTVELIKREGLDTGQIMKCQLIIKRDKYVIDDEFLFTPDLVFSDSSGLNIIDPIKTDEQTSFPLTQTLSIFLEHIENPPSGFFFTSFAR